MGALHITSLLWFFHAACTSYALGDVSYRNAIQNLRTFFRLKTGRGDDSMTPAVWYYSGGLRSAMTGSEVGGVEGVELIQPVVNQATGVTTASEWERSYLSKKLMAFVHRDNRTNLITSHRIRRLSPERKVNPVKVYAEKVTLYVNGTGSPLAKIEWPGSKRVVRTQQFTVQPTPDASWLDNWTGRRGLLVTHSITGVTDDDRNRTSRNGISWGRWVSFGPSGEAQRAGRSQESYAIGCSLTDLPQRNDGGLSGPAGVGATLAANSERSGVWRSLFTAKPEAILHYRRYGEAPPWLAVGQPCIIELTGYRYPNRRSLPAPVQALVDKVDPTFFDFTVPSPVAGRGGTGPITTAGVANGSAALRLPWKTPFTIRRNSEAMSLEWFAAQKDPAEAYVPWYQKALNRAFH